MIGPYLPPRAIMALPFQEFPAGPVILRMRSPHANADPSDGLCIKSAKVRMLDWGGPLSPALGGPTQTIMRLGTRHAIDIDLPTMRSEPDGRIWSTQLRLAKLVGAVLQWPIEFDIGDPGIIAVNGAGQGGLSLTVRGVAESYGFRTGQPFNLIHNGRKYLHFVVNAGFLPNSDGSTTLSIFPMLRVVPTDGDLCDFATPAIQGSLSGNEVAWNLRTDPYVDIPTFTITEDE